MFHISKSSIVTGFQQIVLIVMSLPIVAGAADELVKNTAPTPEQIERLIAYSKQKSQEFSSPSKVESDKELFKQLKLRLEQSSLETDSKQFKVRPENAKTIEILDASSFLGDKHPAHKSQSAREANNLENLELITGMGELRVKQIQQANETFIKRPSTNSNATNLDSE